MPSPAFIVALSGLSSAGKSTIATHLLSIFLPPLYSPTIFHVDDFYKPEAELPYRGALLDWDCVGSLDWPKLEQAVWRWKNGDEVKEGLEGQVNPQPPAEEHMAAVGGDEKPNGDAGITKAVVEQLRGQVPSTDLDVERRRILILDGFLLFTPSVPATFRSLLDLKILLRAPYVDAKGRREARSGYSTMEGWWEDPPGYFDKVVWPNYVEENRCFFIRGEVEGKIDDELCEREGVRAWMGRTDGLEEAFRWVVGEMRKTVEMKVS
ncbi:MAG: hypothetical protein L6R40_005544 [Gallowayella cf. fulva]|nr:MAG: hypothetical protein L6R40_005544 [Xanthomendoza cf. fulva]